MALQLMAYVDGKRRSWIIPEGVTVIGRRGDLTICLPDCSVSRYHASLRNQNDCLSIEDLATRNGTFVNGVRVQEVRPVRSGDRITVGAVDLHVVDSESQKRDADSTGQIVLTPPSVTLDSVPTDRRTSSRLYRVMMDLGEFLASEHTQEEIDGETLRLIERLMPYGRACMLRLDRQGNPLVAAMRATHAEADASAEICWQGVHDALRQRQPVLLEEYRSHSALSGHPKANRVAVIPLNTGDEVLGALYLEAHQAVEGYTTRHLRRLNWIASLLAIKAANARFTVVRDELRTASCMQRALLGRAPKCPRGYEVCARIEPVSAIAGDLYDTLELPNGRCLYAIGDVVGHGVGAALLMASVLAAMRALALNAEDPLDLMARLHEQFRSCVDETSFVTLFLGVLDPAKNRLEFVNAGHPPPAVFDGDGRIRRLDTTGLALGMDFDVPYSSGSVAMRFGSMLCAWSDGLTEARNERLDVDFEDDRLIEIVSSVRHEPLETIVTEAFDAVDRWLEGYAAQDDRTMLLVRRKPEDHS